MTDQSIIPISNEQAKAIQEALKTLQAVGGFLKEMFGTVPADVVGLLGGNWLKVRRAENLENIIRRARKRLEARGIEPEPASLSVGLPLLEAAADEDREELQELWAALLEAAVDPKRAAQFRNVYIEVVKKMDPVDAVVLREMQRTNGSLAPARVSYIANQFHAPTDAVQISISNLEKLEICAVNPGSGHALTALGRELCRAVQIS